jgi:hypothetical protein
VSIALNLNSFASVAVRYGSLAIRVALVFFAVNASYVLGFTNELPSSLIQLSFPELHIAVAKIFTLHLITAAVIARLFVAIGFGIYSAPFVIWERLRLSKAKSGIRAIFRLVEGQSAKTLYFQAFYFLVVFYYLHFGENGASRSFFFSTGGASLLLLIVSPVLTISPSTFFRRLRGSGRAAFKLSAALGLAFGIGTVIFVAAFFAGQSRATNLSNFSTAKQRYVDLRHPLAEGRVIILARSDSFLFGLTFGDSDLIRQYFVITDHFAVSTGTGNTSNLTLRK